MLKNIQVHPLVFMGITGLATGLLVTWMLGLTLDFFQMGMNVSGLMDKIWTLGGMAGLYLLTRKMMNYQRLLVGFNRSFVVWLVTFLLGVQSMLPNLALQGSVYQVLSQAIFRF